MPDLGLPAIKAKVDTGAKSSALHAYNIRAFEKDGQNFVKFKIHPVQRNNKLTRECVAPLVAERDVTSSNGETETRYVVLTKMVFGNKTHEIEAELSLTARHKMTFRMLLGRDAMRKARFVVDPSKSFQLGRLDDAEKLYRD
ncbi:MAG: RimK/LysX family protein [Alphaproteobacteria bacterium]|nr:RimK/LysX family protein [Alphaproteobacteria bacterium]MCD8571470.1 RimK/LysX family protein [Alphaproteobacteria bacterium]